MTGSVEEHGMAYWCRRCVRACGDAVLTVVSLLGLAIGMLLGWDEGDKKGAD